MDHAGVEASIYEHVLSLLYRHRHALWCGCVERDPARTGRVSKEGFAAVLVSIDLALAQRERHLTQAQIEALAETLAEEDGRVPYYDFLQAMVIRDSMEVPSPKTPKTPHTR